MLKSPSLDTRTVLDGVNVLAGLGLALSPWYLGYTGVTAAAWNAWIVGAIVALVAAAALFAFHRAEEWGNLALGLWALVSPWVLGFSAVTAAVAVHLIAGVIIAVLAGGRLRFAESGPHPTA